MYRGEPHRRVSRSETLVKSGNNYPALRTRRRRCACQKTPGCSTTRDPCPCRGGDVGPGGAGEDPPLYCRGGDVGPVRDWGGPSPRLQRCNFPLTSNEVMFGKVVGHFCRDWVYPSSDPSGSGPLRGVWAGRTRRPVSGLRVSIPGALLRVATPGTRGTSEVERFTFWSVRGREGRYW